MAGRRRVARSRITFGRLSVVMMCSGFLVLASCGATPSSGPTARSKSTTSKSTLSVILSHKPLITAASGSQLFVISGTFRVPHDGIYTVVAVGGGGGGGGGGSASTSGGVSDQVGGAGGAAGAVTVKSFYGHTGQRFAIVVTPGGNPGVGGAANGGSGTRGGTGGRSSCVGIASADGGVGGAGSPGNSNATVLGPVAAGNASYGTVRGIGSGGGAGVLGGGVSGSANVYAWPGGGGGGTASSDRRWDGRRVRRYQWDGVARWGSRGHVWCQWGQRLHQPRLHQRCGWGRRRWWSPRGPWRLRRRRGGGIRGRTLRELHRRIDTCVPYPVSPAVRLTGSQVRSGWRWPARRSAVHRH